MEMRKRAGGGGGGGSGSAFAIGFGSEEEEEEVVGLGILRQRKSLHGSSPEAVARLRFARAARRLASARLRCSSVISIRVRVFEMVVEREGKSGI